MGAALAPLLLAADLAHVLLAVASATVTARLVRRDGHEEPVPLAQLEEYALLVDLLAACLAAGAPLPVALREVAASTSGPVGSELGRASRLWTLGAGALEVAGALADAGPVLRPLASVVAAAETGGPLARQVAGLAEDARRDRRGRRLAAARRVGPRSALPLTLCFLPAFLLVSVVPLLATAAAPFLA